jgi:hypothetical protein
MQPSARLSCVRIDRQCLIHESRGVELLGYKGVHILLYFKRGTPTGPSRGPIGVAEQSKAFTVPRDRLRVDQNSPVEYCNSLQTTQAQSYFEGCELRGTESCRGWHDFCASALALVADDFNLSMHSTTLENAQTTCSMLFWNRTASKIYGPLGPPPSAYCADPDPTNGVGRVGDGI